MRSLAGLFFATFLVAACSGGGGGGGGNDPDPITVSIGNPGIPGIAITLNDATGAFVEILHTDSSGEASFHVPEGGSFSIYRVEDDGDRRVFHVLAPAAGESFLLPFVPVDPGPPPPTPNPAYADVTLNPVPGGATGSQVETPCTSFGSDMLTISMATVGCDGASTAPQVVAYALDSLNRRVGWGQATDVAVTPGGTVPLAIDASDTTFLSLHWDVTGIPATHANGTFLDVSTDYVELGEFGVLQPAGMTTSSAAGLVPPGLGAVYRSRVFAQLEVNTGEIGEGFSEDRYSTTHVAVTQASDLGAFPLARVFMEIPDVADAARPTLSWTRGTGTPGTAAQVSYYAETAATEFVEHSVYFVPQAGTGGTVRIPEAPEELASFRMSTFFEASVTAEEPREPADLLLERADGLLPPGEGEIRYAFGYYQFP